MNVLCLFVAVALAPASAPVPSAVAPRTVPALLVLPHAAGPVATFTDRDGAHRVTFVLADAPAQRDSEGARSRTLRVTHELTGPGATKPVRVWQAQDFVLDCPLDVTLELIDGSIGLTDLDGNGRPEVSFAYVLSCRSDVSPDDMKLLLYEGPRKYALRGTRATPSGAIDDHGEPVLQGGGPPEMDPAFKSAPAVFLSWALERWRELQPK